MKISFHSWVHAVTRAAGVLAFLLFLEADCRAAGVFGHGFTARESSGFIRFNRSVVAADGSVYVAGEFSGTIQLDQIQGDANAVLQPWPGISTNGFIAKFDQDGNWIWGRPLPNSMSWHAGNTTVTLTPSNYAVSSVAARNGHLYVGGNCTTANRRSSYILDLTADGQNPNLRLLLDMPQTETSSTTDIPPVVSVFQNNAQLNDLVVDSEGNVFASGAYLASGTSSILVYSMDGTGEARVGPAILPPISTSTVFPVDPPRNLTTNLFCLRVNANGVLQWISVGGVAGQHGLSSLNAMALRPDGTVFVGGILTTDLPASLLLREYRAPSIFVLARETPVTLTFDTRGQSHFIARLNHDTGAWENYTSNLGGTATVDIRALHYSRNALYVGGAFNGNMRMYSADSGNPVYDLVSQRQTDGFVMKLTDDLYEQKISLVTGNSDDDVVTWIGSEDGGDIRVAGLFGGPSAEFGPNITKLVAKTPGASLFASALDSNLGWKWAQCNSENDIPPVGWSGVTAAINRTSGRTYVAGGYASGSLILANTSAGTQRVLRAGPGRQTAFVTMVDKANDGAFLSSYQLTVESAAGSTLIKPGVGVGNYLEGTVVIAKAPAVVYFDKDQQELDPALPGFLDQAVKRFTSLGYEIDGTAIQRPDQLYEAVLDHDLKVIFKWKVEYALKVVNRPSQNNSSLAGELESPATGRPIPGDGTSWFAADSPQTATISGVEVLPGADNFGVRYICDSYQLTTNGPSGPITSSKSFTSVQDRQAVPEFKMDGPVTVTYHWKKQIRIQASTTIAGGTDGPQFYGVNGGTEQLLLAAPNVDPNDRWFDAGLHLRLKAKPTLTVNGRALDLLGFRIGTGHAIGHAQTEKVIDIPELTRPTAITWDYGQPIFTGEALIGTAISFEKLINAVGQTVNFADPNDPSRIDSSKKPKAVTVQQGPPGKTDRDMTIWSPLEQKLYPLTPGKMLIEWETVDSTSENLKTVLTEISIPDPEQSRSKYVGRNPVTYQHVANTPPVALDPRADDALAFANNGLKFSTSGTTVDARNQFQATNPGYAVLLFTSTTNANAGVPAYGPATLVTNDFLDLPNLAHSLQERPRPVDVWLFSQLSPNTKTTLAAYVGGTSDAGSLRMGLAQDLRTILRGGSSIYVVAGFDGSITLSAETLDLMSRNPQGEDLARLNRLLLVDAYPLALARTPTAPPVARGDTSDTSTEYFSIRIAYTKLWMDGLQQASADIGQPITEAGSNSTLENNGYVFWPNAPHNPRIYDREKRSGPIIPVNFYPWAKEVENQLVVVWYQTQDGISWPYGAKQYTPVWPASAKRIVIASRLGSEGLDAAGQAQTLFTSDSFQNVEIYQQPDRSQPGFNPNEEHAVIKPSFLDRDPNPRPAAFALRNDLNVTNRTDPNYTSEPYVLVQYQDTTTTPPTPRMAVYQVTLEDEIVNDPRLGDFNRAYTFRYEMEAGHLIAPPYPLNLLMGTVPSPQTDGKDLLTSGRKCFWKDVHGQMWALSGNGSSGNSPATDPDLEMRFYYPNRADFWLPPSPATVATTVYSPFAGKTAAGTMQTNVVQYDVIWPTNTPVLKVGETLTFPGGEYRADHPEQVGLPGVVGFASSEIVFDDLNPTMNADPDTMLNYYIARLVSPLEERKLVIGDLPTSIKTETDVAGRKVFSDLPASLRSRISYDPATKSLVLRGFLNGRTLGDNDLTAAPPSITVLQPNILTRQDRAALEKIGGSDDRWKTATTNLYRLARHPLFPNLNAPSPYLNSYAVGLVGSLGGTADKLTNVCQLGYGSALVCNPALLGPTGSAFTDGYLVLAENNHTSLGNAPISLHIIRVLKSEQYRGAIQPILGPNVFDEKITLRHSADFGGNVDDLVFEWYYRPDSGEPVPPPFTAGSSDPSPWVPFVVSSQPDGMGLSEISLAGAGSVLLGDNLFYVRWRHANAPFPANGWAGAANSRPPVPPELPVNTYHPQLAEGWVKRVVNAITPYESRAKEFRGTEDAPATYVDMIRQAGPRFEGAVALNPNPSVLENLGLIELYTTVLNRASSVGGLDPGTGPSPGPAVIPAVLNAASRVAEFYLLLGNEAYTDALDPTIGFGSGSGEYGALAPTIFTFQNQVPTLLEEELALLRGRDTDGARPVYNRLLWNFTRGQGEVAYAQSYNLADVNRDGLIDEADARAMFPQGHGDAWGHYSSALKTYYSLLQNSKFNWAATAETFAIEGVTVSVDYRDERRFAQAAAARARAGTEIINLTYRSKYVEDPDGQWQGYTDTDTNRGWGVTDWARRAGQAAYLDWVTANAVLPASSTNTGIRKVDRTTVPELNELSAQLTAIQGKLDAANTGLNPLGLATDVVPFDIDPVRVDRGSSRSATHFEQLYERAVGALANAQQVFDHANQINQNLRRAANDAEAFSRTVDEQDRDYRNRLIEIFGSPYEGTIGAGKPYPSGYQGPDYFYPNYLDVASVSTKNDSGLAQSLAAAFQPGVERLAFIETGTMQAPVPWGKRASPGAIQMALNEFVESDAKFQAGLADYNAHLTRIITQRDLIQGKLSLAFAEITLRNAVGQQISDVGVRQLEANLAGAAFGLLASAMEKNAEIAADALPKVAGPAAVDWSGPMRYTIRSGATLGSKVFKGLEMVATRSAAVLEQWKLKLLRNADIEIEKIQYLYAIQEQMKELERLLAEELGKRLDVAGLQQKLAMASDNHRNVLQDGLRLLEERRAFHQKTAAAVQKTRYQDMTFRLSRNDALQKFRAAFDLAARYVYLAAKAYDYETNLDPRDPASAQPLLTEIIRQRTLGEFRNGQPVIGNGGLADAMAKLKVNFDVLKGQMGFNNPQTETDRFSLRTELFRIRTGTDGNESWRRTLQNHKVEDLWKVSEFRRYCRPFAPESAGPQPGLVIPFSSQIIFGRNFFGWPLGGADHSYDPTHFATKVRSVGLWFDNYLGSGLSLTPRVYLVPAGLDIMLVPTSGTLQSREWNVVDQRLPVPLPVGAGDLLRPDWIPARDTLNGTMAEIRRYSSFRAYHNSGLAPEEEFTFDSRLVGRSVWNTRWLLIIPGGTLLADSASGLNTFISEVTDIKLLFQTYAISGN